MVIYKTTNTITGHFYIGQSVRNTSSYLGSGIRLKSAIEKYGRENFIRETLCECSSQEELDNMERYWIKILDSKNPNVGYNLDCGGRHWNGLNGLTSKKISKS